MQNDNECILYYTGLPDYIALYALYELVKGDLGRGVLSSFEKLILFDEAETWYCSCGFSRSISGFKNCSIRCFFTNSQCFIYKVETVNLLANKRRIVNFNAYMLSCKIWDKNYNRYRLF